MKVDARKRKVITTVSDAEYAVLVARAEACTQGNVSHYIRTQLFGEEQVQPVRQTPHVDTDTERIAELFKQPKGDVV